MKVQKVDKTLLEEKLRQRRHSLHATQSLIKTNRGDVNHYNSSTTNINNNNNNVKQQDELKSSFSSSNNNNNDDNNKCK